MQRYMYQHGDHPLEGYTIQRASGRGGFGEVYYALSDSGREVALKAVQNYEQIELRGITQCMNLKSPHLVTIFDVKYNDRGQPFVIMEYVSGPSLRTLLAESPGGLGKQKAAFFLREIAKGLSYLHECGIVHRDLKPGNIFYENGYVKVGDYGLTKAISASRHSGHTITVGTVHYMAPEIGAGKYNFGIDIYALGVLLYEMITGDVPFAGESPAEILMKHMTSEPEMKNIDEPFAHVIKKAMAKDPDERYQSVQEMVEDLFGEENIRNSVSHFAPEELSIIAQQVAAKAKIDDSPKEQTPKTPAAAAANQANANNNFAHTANNIYDRVDKIGRKVVDKVDTRVDNILGAKKTRIPGVTDPIEPKQRYFLAFISMIVVSLGAGFLQARNGGDVLGIAFGTFILINVCANTILLTRRHWFANLEPGSQWLERIIAPLIAAFLVQFISGFFGFEGHQSVFLPMFFSMIFIDWRRLSLPDRQKRLSLGSALWAGLLGAIASGIFGTEPILIAAVLAGTSLAVQAISSFGEQEQEIVKKHRKHRTEFHTSLNQCIVPRFLRVIFFIGSLLSLGFGLFLLILAGAGNLRGDEFALAVGFGINGLILSVFLFIKFCCSKFKGWYRYIIKPAIQLLCLFTIIISAVFMGNTNPQNDEFAIALFFIIFPAIVFIAITAIPAKAIVGNAPRPPKPQIPQANSGVSPYKRLWALLFSAGGLFWMNGLQRFYVGKIWTGILWFCTFGMFWIGQIIDVIMILTGNFKDCYGRPVLIWHDKAELSATESFAQNVATAPEYKMSEEEKEPEHEYTPEPAPELHEEPASHTPAFASSTIYEPFHPFAFLCSGIGFIMVLLAIVVGIASALKVPNFVAAQWPDVSADIDSFFGGYPDWPRLVTNLGIIAMFVFLFLGAVFVILGRRHWGIQHLVRALLGLVGLLFAFLAFAQAFPKSYPVGFNELLRSGQKGPAFDMLLNSISSSEVIVAGIIFLVSVVILAWPPNKQIILSTPQTQGVTS